MLAWYLSRRITEPVLGAVRGGRRGRRRHYGVEIPTAGGDEIGHLAERFRGMAERLAEAEELERNFLMSVSHELRTPLTAIRGHVEALREGVVDDPSGTESLDDGRGRRPTGSSGWSATSSTWRSSRPTASPCCHEEVDMGRLSSRRTSVQRGGAAPRIDYRATSRRAR